MFSALYQKCHKKRGMLSIFKYIALNCKITITKL